MTMEKQAEQAAIDRRDFMVAGVGAAALAAVLGSGDTAAAQAAPGPAASPAAPPAEPGRVVVERREAMLLVGLDRPKSANLLDVRMIIELGKAYYQLEHDDGLRVAVLHGIGADFCPGFDVASSLAARAAGTWPPKDPDFIDPFARPPVLTKPVVVAVQGQTRTAGHELFLAADIRVSATDAVFSQGEVTRGAFPGGGATVRLTREAGWGNAMFHMLTGEGWGAEEAHRMGLVHVLVPPGKQLDRAIEIATKVAAAAPLGVRATLASAHQAISSENAALQAVTAEFGRILQSEDVKEGARAAREGRSPVFRGQ
jgi:enoyl-CoA hydratase